MIIRKSMSRRNKIKRILNSTLSENRQMQDLQTQEAEAAQERRTDSFSMQILRRAIRVSERETQAPLTGKPVLSHLN